MDWMTTYLGKGLEPSDRSSTDPPLASVSCSTQSVAHRVEALTFFLSKKQSTLIVKKGKNTFYDVFQETKVALG